LGGKIGGPRKGKKRIGTGRRPSKSTGASFGVTDPREVSLTCPPKKPTEKEGGGEAWRKIHQPAVRKCAEKAYRKRKKTEKRYTCSGKRRNLVPDRAGKRSSGGTVRD